MNCILVEFRLAVATLAVLTSLSSLACGKVDDPSGGAAGAGGDAAIGSAGQPATGPAGAAPCDPLEADPGAVTLSASDVVGAGQSSDGTLYVMAKVAGSLRLFVGDRTGLSEKFSKGSGEGTEGSVRFATFSYTEAGATTTIEVDRDGASTRLGKYDGLPPNKRIAIGVDGEELTQVDANEAVAIQSQTDTSVVLEYSGSSSTGIQLVVTAPMHRIGFEGYRVFLGPVDGIKELIPLAVTRTLSPPAVTIANLTIDGAPATLFYDVEVATISNQATGEEARFTGMVPPTIPAGARFECQ